MKEEQPQDDSEERLTSENEHDEPMRARPRIYVASLSDYNAGRLHGTWLDAAQSLEDLQAAISEMLAASPEPSSEEWAIHDFEGFGQLRLDEYESIDRVATVARSIEEYGPAFAAWAALVGIDADEELDRFGECYLGHWESVAAYAEQYVEDTGVDVAVDTAAGSLAPYVRIDTGALARDMELGGDLSSFGAPDGGVFLFGQ